MPWFKGNAGEQAPFMVGSDRWLGSRTPSTAPSYPQSQGDASPQVAEDQATGSEGQGTTGHGAAAGGGYPEVFKYSADTGLKSSAPGSREGPSSRLPPTNGPAPGIYPVVYTGMPDTSCLEEAVSAVNLSMGTDPVEKVVHKEEVEAHEEVLVSVPGAIVHLIDEEESLHLGTGELQLVRLIQEGSGVAVFVRVGGELQWPLFKDECAVRLDPTHYFFTLKVPSQFLDDDEDVQRQSSDASSQGGLKGGLRREGSGDVRTWQEAKEASGQQREQQGKGSASEAGLQTLNYGVTFSQAGVESALEELDSHLARYSLFTAPTVVKGRGPSESQQKVDGAKGTPYTEGKPYSPPSFRKSDGVVSLPEDKTSRPSELKPAVPAKIVTPEELNGHGQPLTEPNSAVYWTALAPNVADYSSSPARAIAQGSGQIIRGLFWVSQATVSNLERGSAYMLEQGWIKPRTKGPMEFSPRTRKNMKRVKSVSKMTSKVAKSVLTGVITTTGVFTGAVVNSKAGNKFFKLLPGEVALVSLDAFSKVFDAVEHAGKAVLKTSSSITTEMVTRRYGAEAGDFTQDGLKTTGHVITTAWTVSKIRKAFNPKSLTKTGITKSVLKAAVVNQQKP